jgi:outer membrane lipoprotein-sorting protein
MRAVLFFTLAVSCLAATTEEVLSKMDQAAPKFSTMSADLTRVTYTKVIDDKSIESGLIRLKKTSPRDLRVLIDFTKPDVKTVAFHGRKGEIYYPKLKTVQEYDLGEHANLIDQFLLVGFGSSGKDLKANYSVKVSGEETVGGISTTKLELLPLVGEVKEKLRKVELWIADNGSYPVQQRFMQSSGDYYLFTYSGVKINPPLRDDELKLNLPKGVKREQLKK